MKFFIVSLGCPKNTVDSERFEWVLRTSGWRRAESLEDADLALLNTCAFIQPAVEESMDNLQDLLDWRREGAGRKLVLAGCLPGRYEDDGSGGLVEIDLMIGPGDWKSLASWLGRAVHGDAGIHGSGPVRFLKIAEGCDNRCAYCTIPSIRGGFVPVPRRTVLREADILVEQGAREIGIVAQDTGRWSADGSGLVELTDSLAERHPDTWFRLYYIHPAHFPEGLTGLFQRRSNVLPYVDMPVQHASTAVLKRMGRGYGEDRIRGIMETLEDCVPPVAVRYTVITGYPGETEADFQRLVRFLGDYRCGRHIAAFTWYPEEGTREYERTIRQKDAVDQGTAEERLAVISSVGDSLYESWNQRLHGMELTVLADDPWFGHTVWDTPDVDSTTEFTEEVAPGGFVRARVVEARGADILAEPLPD